MGKIADLTGQKFGALTALSFAGTKNHRVVWSCQCDCGNIHEARASDLKDGSIKSCGCSRKHGPDEAIEAYTKRKRKVAENYRNGKLPSFMYT